MPRQLIQSATKFHAEVWTIISDSKGERELWAVIMDDGSDAGYGCAFGPEAKMREYADRLNANGGVLD